MVTVKEDVLEVPETVEEAVAPEEAPSVETQNPVVEETVDIVKEETVENVEDKKEE